MSFIVKGGQREEVNDEASTADFKKCEKERQAEKGNRNYGLEYMTESGKIKFLRRTFERDVTTPCANYFFFLLPTQ